MSVLKSDIGVVFGEGGVYTTEPHVTGILLYPPPAPSLLLFWVKKTPGCLVRGQGVSTLQDTHRTAARR